MTRRKSAMWDSELTCATDQQASSGMRRRAPHVCIAGERHGLPGEKHHLGERKHQATYMQDTSELIL